MKAFASSLNSLSVKTLVSLAIALPLLWGALTYLSIIIVEVMLSEVNRVYGRDLFWFLRVLIFISLLYIAFTKIFSPLSKAQLRNLRFFSVMALILAGIGVLTRSSRAKDYIFYGVLISPIVEEVGSRFSLSYIKEHGTFAAYALVAVCSSAAFSLMHLGYSMNNPHGWLLAQKLQEHFAFALSLSILFWFIPRFWLLVAFHSLANLYFTWGLL